MKTVKLDIEPGIKLFLQPESCLETEPQLEFTVILESVTDDGHIVIGAPIRILREYTRYRYNGLYCTSVKRTFGSR